MACALVKTMSGLQLTLAHRVSQAVCICDTGYTRKLYLMGLQHAEVMRGAVHTTTADTYQRLQVSPGGESSVQFAVPLSQCTSGLVRTRG